MKKPLLLLFGGLLLIILILAGLLSARTSTVSTGPRVAATIFPVADLTERVAGDLIEVELILEPGASPHTFELTPRKATRLAGISAVFGIGHGLDNWAAGIAEVSDAPVVHLDEHADLHCGEDVHVHDHDDDGHDEHEEEEDDHHEDEDSHEEEVHDEHESEEACDPHYWLSVPNAIAMVEQIEEELSTIYPAHADTFQANAEETTVELEALDTEIRSIAEGANNTNVITFHDSYNYFAEEYGFEVRGSFEPSPGQEPTPRELAELQELVQLYSIQTLFSEPQLSQTSVSAFVKDVDVAIMELDPLGGADDRASYDALMRYNANILSQAQ